MAPADDGTLPIPPGFLDLARPRHDQRTYAGRVRHFVEITSPATLLASGAELDRAKTLIEDYTKRGRVHRGVSMDEYWRAKQLYAATFHPDTGEKVVLPFRMASFVPTNMLIIAGMLVPNPSTASIVFWQWLNQSVNVAINYANANKSAPMSVREAGTAYAAAVSTSVGVALGMNAAARRFRLPRMLAPVVPFSAVALAGTANVFLMRQKELRDGIVVRDAQGNELGTSRRAGWMAVSQVAVTRALTALPCLFVPDMVLARLEKRAFFRAHPRLLVPLNLALIAGSLMTALPCAIGLFPQHAEVPLASLEPEFHHRTAPDGTPLATGTYNKGL